jgi:hypothetical protein
MSDAHREAILKRFEEAGLDRGRFINVQDGEKGTYDHDNRFKKPPAGNYGIYAKSGDGVVLIDVDDYGSGDDNPGLDALEDLPETLTQLSPHGGTHRIFRVPATEDRELISDLFEEKLGTKNPKPGYGEVRAANQYVVGAGSQLEGCDKDWCERCGEDDGGYYRVEVDQEIAVVDPETLIDVLLADPKIERDDVEPESPELDHDADELDLEDQQERLEFALEHDDKLERLWNGDYSDYNGDRSAAESALAMKLGWWFDRNKSTVRGLMDESRAEKWAERPDDSYRDSVLSAVDMLSDQWEPSDRPEPTEDDVTVEDDAGSRTLPIPKDFAVEAGRYGAYYETDDGMQFSTWTNFQLEVNSFLHEPDGSTKVDITVWPVDGEPYDVVVEPTVFNEVRDFKSAVCTGLTTTFEGGQSELNSLKRFVGRQDAPHRTGTSHMGLHGGEWVTPNGVLTADGWIDDPTTVYIERDIGVERKWSLAPSDGSEYDASNVRDTLRLIPQTRSRERIVPVMGWFYAAPLRPLIHDWTGQFNLLFVMGETGSGKTTTLETLWQAFGMQGEPLTADDTTFTLLSTLGSTNSVPMWFDEYKPSDMADYEVDRFWNEIRKTTRGGVSQRGNADKSTTEYHLHAPAVVSGEERVAGSAEERRGVFSTFRKDVTNSHSETARAYAKLTGNDYKEPGGGITRYDGVDLSDHALAYYQHILELSEEQLHEAWRDSAEKVNRLLADEGIYELEDLVEQGLQTIHFGCTLYRHFAEAVGADVGDIMDQDTVHNAILYCATRSQGGVNRKSHIDSFFELAARAAQHEYLEEGEHFKFVHAGEPEEELRINMATSYDKVARYAREHDVSEDLLNSKDDYRERLRDLVDEDDSYVEKYSYPTTGLGRCIGIRWEDAVESLDDFDKGMWTEIDEADEEASDIRPTPLGEISPGYETVTVEAVVVEEHDDPRPPLTGTVVDNSDIVDMISWDSDFVGVFEEDSCYRIDHCKVGYDQDGAQQLEMIGSLTEVKEIQSGAGNLSKDEAGEGQSDLSAATDGGEMEMESTTGQIIDWWSAEKPDQDLTVAQIAGATGHAPDKIKRALGMLANNGKVIQRGTEFELNQ